jgi:hypothetical protein
MCDKEMRRKKLIGGLFLKMTSHVLQMCHKVDENLPILMQIKNNN